MKRIDIIRGLAIFAISVLFIPAATQAQDEIMNPSDSFSREELAQMLASVALYPDSMIADILMASTYPLEIVEAERWLRANSGLTGADLDNALNDKTWDTSIKSLCHFPDVLFAMSSNLDQTRKLGDAYLAQPDDVMAMIQEFRRKARDQGTLKSTSQFAVSSDGDDIIIDPVDPLVIYVPVYDPSCVYGPWWYPAYSPWYWYYPSSFSISYGCFSFGPAFYFDFDFFYWCRFDWHRHRIHVDRDRIRRFDRRRGSGDTFWSFDPRHRRGVAYRDTRTSDRFGGVTHTRQSMSPETRGYPSEGVKPRVVGSSGTRTEQGERAVVPRTAPRAKGLQRQETPFRGVGNGNFERRAAERGGQSRGSGTVRQNPPPAPQGAPQGKPSGGGSRGRQEKFGR